MMGAIILAAGASSRMGTSKALLEYRGEPFLIRILRTVGDVKLAPAVVVLGPDGDKILSQLDLSSSAVVRNAEPETGPLQSLKLGLAAFNRTVEGVLVWHVDRPRVSRATVSALLQKALAGPEPIVVPSHHRRRGHPVVFMRAVFDELMQAPNANGARAVVRANPARVAVVEVDDPAVLEDVNTPEDYEALA